MRIAGFVQRLFGGRGTVQIASWLLSAFLAAPVVAQVDFVRSDYFPADLEFGELKGTLADFSADRSHASGVPDADLFQEAGFQGYKKRTYSTESGGKLAIEVVTFKDTKAAYSLLTVLRVGGIEKGPPGDFHSTAADALLFSQANVLVRITGDRELARRVGVSVGNRIGAHDIAPLLVSRFPAAGLDSSSVRYLLGREALERYGSSRSVRRLALPADVEVAQARYSLDAHGGTLALVNFPTSQLAGEYYDRIFRHERRPALEPAGGGLYFRRAGPIVGILEGDFDPRAADRILGSIEFTYSVQWIFDKQNQKPRTVFGVPVAVLGTVVRSLFFTALLCGLSLGAGVVVALFRVMLRTYAPGNFLDRPERTGLIRLKIDEN